MYEIRNADTIDFDKIFSLYQKVASQSVGLARSGEEITEQYVQNFMRHSSQSGIELIVEDPNNRSQVIAEIHCYKLVPKVFTHVLSELTIAVDPDFQGKGIGKMIFSQLLDFIKINRHDVLRVELISRESNLKAITLYQKLGFKIEGKFEKRIQNNHGQFEADIPMAWFNPNYVPAH